MSYTKALYYPTIDIEDDEWLKNAVLFWDEIDTIVPESMQNPYQNVESKFLFDEGILKPIYLSSEDTMLGKVEQQIFKFSEQEDSLAFLQKETDDNTYGDLRADFILHRDKLPISVLHYLCDKKLIDADGWAKVSANFADYYMTLLATSLAKKKHMCLLTGDSAPYELSTIYSFGMVDNPTTVKKKIAEGFLFKLMVDGFKISKTESLKDLLDYKCKRKDELGRFRSALAGLTNQQNFTDVESIDELKEVVHTIYENDFLPALTEVKETMTDRGITFIENLSSYVTTFFTPSLFLNSINELSCAIGTGACLVHWGASERLRVRNIKRSNPYSYLLSLKNDGKVMF